MFGLGKMRSMKEQLNALEDRLREVERAVRVDNLYPAFAAHASRCRWVPAQDTCSVGKYGTRVPLSEAVAVLLQDGGYVCSPHGDWIIKKHEPDDPSK